MRFPAIVDDEGNPVMKHLALDPKNPDQAQEIADKYELVRKRLAGWCELVDASHIVRTLRLVKYRREGHTFYYSCDDDHVIHMLLQTIRHVQHD